MNSHIINGHYMFGNTFIQPEMPNYYRIPHHNMAPVKRPMPPYPDMINKPCSNNQGCCLGYEDSCTKVDTPYDDSSYDSNKCKFENCPLNENGVVRDSSMFNVVNVETTIIKTLKLTIYHASEEQDKTIEMHVGNRYAITYITEHGLVMTIGRLELISDSIPDKCTRYINTNNMVAASTAYIGMDCSKEGSSDQRKIYIATIRNIQEIKENEEVESEELINLRAQLNKLLTDIKEGKLVWYNDIIYPVPVVNDGSDTNIVLL